MRHVKINRNLLLFALGAVLLVGGCCCPPPSCPPCYVVDRTAATVAPLPPPTVKPSGFLSNYGLLKANPDREGSFVWEKPGLDLRVYDHLMFDDIQVILDDGETAAVPKEIQEKAADFFHEILLETIDPYYSVVTEPALHVLRVKIALTDLKAAPEMEEGKPGVHSGGAELEGELVDSLTGDRLLMFVSRIEGSEKGQEAPKEWQAVEGAFREWASRLLTYLDTWAE